MPVFRDVDFEHPTRQVRSGVFAVKGRPTPYHGGDSSGNWGPPLKELDCDGLVADQVYHAISSDLATRMEGAFPGAGFAEQAREQAALAGEAKCEWCKRGCPGAADDPACDSCSGPADLV